MDYRKFSLAKIGDKLIKALDAKEHFDKREQEKSYIRKVQVLKEILTQEYKFAYQNKVNHPHYANKLKDIEKDINYIRKVHSRQSLESHDKAQIDSLMSKYGA